MDAYQKRVLIFIGSGILTSVFLFFAFLNFISPGHVGVVVSYFGDDKGVAPRSLGTGMHWIAPWERIYQFPVFQQNITWEGLDEDSYAFDFQTKEGMAVCADIGVSFSLNPLLVPELFRTYRRGIDEISHIFVRNHVRDSINAEASKMAIEDLYGSGKEQFLSDVQSCVSNDLRPLGLCIDRIYLIGRFGFPQRVVDALNAKIEATQRAQQRENELREAEAQAKKEIAKAQGTAQCVVLQAESEAKANNVLSSSITAELIQWQAVQKWNGQLPQVNGSGVNTLIPLKG